MSEDKIEREIELRSDEIEEILGKTPSWVLRRGIAVSAMVIFLLFTATWVFHYPDIIVAPAIITSSNPPSLVVSRSGGKIMSFLIKDQQQVNAGDYLAVLENPAGITALNSLRTFFMKADSAVNSLTDLEVIKEPLTHLGDLQQPYLDFIQALQNYKRYTSLSLNAKKIESVRKQIALTNSFTSKLKEQKLLQEKNLHLVLNQFRRDSGLYTQNVLTPAEYDKAQSLMIAGKAAYKDSELALSNSMIEINRLEQQIIELQISEEKETKQLVDEVNNTYKSLKSRFDSWELAYVLRSSTTGTVSIFNYWSINQNVKPGDVIMSVVPDEVKEPFGKLTLNMKNSGKVKIGQRVNIKLTGYPYIEYGMLTGKVRSISMVPDDGRYYVEIDLPDGLRTSYSKELPFRQEMEGTAEIITEDMRLIQRIFSPVRSLYKEKIEVD
jgi:HlyD family secretion protein